MRPLCTSPCLPHINLHTMHTSLLALLALPLDLALPLALTATLPCLLYGPIALPLFALSHTTHTRATATL